MGVVVDSLARRIPDQGTYDADTVKALEGAINHPSRLPSLALEVFPGSRYQRMPAHFWPGSKTYSVVSLQFESLWQGFSGELGIAVLKGDARASYLQFQRGSRVVQVRENTGLYLLELNGGRTDLDGPDKTVTDFLSEYLGPSERR